jgi:hypothetical protein
MVDGLGDQRVHDPAAGGRGVDYRGNVWGSGRGEGIIMSRVVAITGVVSLFLLEIDQVTQVIEHTIREKGIGVVEEGTDVVGFAVFQVLPDGHVEVFDI